jgi:hypothetical protein
MRHPPVAAPRRIPCLEFISATVLTRSGPAQLPIALRWH